MRLLLLLKAALEPVRSPFSEALAATHAESCARGRDPRRADDPRADAVDDANDASASFIASDFSFAWVADRDLCRLEVASSAAVINIAILKRAS